MDQNSVIESKRVCAYLCGTLLPLFTELPRRGVLGKLGFRHKVLLERAQEEIELLLL